MKYINNYANWINKYNIIEMLDSKQGECTPVWQPDRWTGNETLEKFREMARPGYSNNTILYILIYQKLEKMRRGGL
jgi:hypothetical protein